MARRTHPHVVPIKWAADQPDHVCIAMPLMTGGSLADRIAKIPVSPRRLVAIAQDLCDGVAHVHTAGYVHLDIKPTNVLFDENGRAAITDFGQALALDRGGTADTRDHRMYASFVPPEVRRGAVATVAADVYQLGLTLYRAVGGERSFRLQRDRVRSSPDPFAIRDAIAAGSFPERVLLPFVPLGIRRAIFRSLNIDPTLRQRTARDLANELAAVHIRHDWQVDLDEEDQTTWRLKGDGRSDVIVHRIGTLPDARVEIWTNGPAGPRRKAARQWISGIRRESQIKKALNRAFRAAES
jgi:eukaryotic-like serine/threonine-protein kinase